MTSVILKELLILIQALNDVGGYYKCQFNENIFLILSMLIVIV